MKKSIHLLGATGSIGRQTLEVLRAYPERFRLGSFTFHSNIDLALDIIREFKPSYVSGGSKEMADKIALLYPEVRVGYGMEGLIEAAIYDDEHPILVNAVVGSVGLRPTIEAIKCGYPVALANKETLVTAGHLVMDLVQRHKTTLLPIDSEHSAIFQSLHAGRKEEIRRIIITASGGSLRHLTREELDSVTIEDVMNHPNWSMGSKITVDLATMMNKGLEVIEAHWLFGLPYDQIETLLHRESIIHSMVEFVDRSVIAQLGTPDMKEAIQYAITYPDRLDLIGDPLDLAALGKLHFEAMDVRRFVMLDYAYEAGRLGGSMPTVLNASNEAAVRLYLQGKIPFLEIEKLVYNALNHHKLISDPDLETVLAIDEEIKTTILTSR